MHNFVQELPPTFLEYSKLVNETFPVLIDTKLLANHLRRDFPRLNNYLDGMYRDCFENNDLLYKYNNVVSTRKDEKFHDAAFDAYVTGVFFVCCFNYLLNRQSS